MMKDLGLMLTVVAKFSCNDQGERKRKEVELESMIQGHFSL
jgi:hypothetical protein